jgi:TolB-like protein/DNA-binding winged helix-turn-helix (wHTH) protein/Flp pilus assembly protein TadD
MNDNNARPRLLRFGVFEVDLRAAELRKQGLKVKLCGQPFQILALLLERPGEAVTREEIREKLWPEGTFIDFEHSVNSSIKRLREALGDAAEHPRYIETLPRRGYRFLGPVEAVSPAPSPAISARPVSPPPAATLPGKAGAGADRRRNWLRLALIGTGLTAIAATFLALNVGGLRDRLVRAVGAGHTVPLPKIESIAVLPLENLSGDPQQEYFADGMTDELITNLGKLSALRVISRTSVMRYKGTRKPLPEIANELNVDAVVEGAVLRSGERVRVTANLVHARTDRHLWAESYERDRRDALTLQGEVARAIANEIEIKVTPNEQRRMGGSRPVNPEAYEAYLLGRYQWNRRTEESLEKAAEYFQKAIEKDPRYAPAYAGLADCYAIFGDNGFRRPRDVFPQARTSAMRALEIDPTLAEAHTSLASVMKAYEWDWAGAEKEIRRAIELNPNYSTARQFHGELLECVGRFDEAVAELKRARQLDPFAPRIHTILAWTLYLARRYDEGIEELRKGLEVDPYHAALFAVRGEIYLQKGMYEQAMADLRQAAALLPGPYYPYLDLVRGYAVSGRKREALKALNELSDLAKRRYVMPTSLALAYSELGDRQQAFAWLEKAYDERDPWLGLTINSEPGFDRLRSDPHFRDILRRMNFPP